jgi:hypothetical protein
MARRLRRWVAVSDDDDSSLPFHLDEQGIRLALPMLTHLEQEKVIKSLRTENARSNDLFKVTSVYGPR